MDWNCPAERKYKAKMKTLKLLLIQLIIFTTVLSAQNTNKNNFLYFSSDQIENVKNAIDNKDSRVTQYSQALKAMADSAIDDGPWSITSVMTKAVSGNAHDFFSEGPYWWPDTENPNGPYIRKDGLRNHDRFTAHDDMMGEISNTVSILSYAAYLFDEEKYAKRAAYLLNVWFVDEETKMNPHLQYAQAIRNITDGRGIGIIETNHFTQLIEALNFLKQSGYWKDKDYNGVKNWFGKFAVWLTTSKNGLDEKMHGNNHSSWWTAQVIAYSIFSGHNEILDDMWAHTKDFLIETQIAKEGNFPLEDERTRSLHYSVFNLNALASICKIGDEYNQNLWNYISSNGVNVLTSINYIIPFLENPSTWTKQEISHDENFDTKFLAFAGFALNNNKYIELFKKFETGQGDKSRSPFNIVLNMIVSLH
ncbi:MAG: hypothetical protein A2068_05255 [Ignavibacteria bacterium GWB2_35_6b]|nr:MAG: hypothetical protein A2068_05255 [Ignavibacteria bacterium GWB2_35_6b]